MNTLTATKPIITARLQQVVRKKHRSGVIGLRAQPTWDGGTFTHDNVTVSVVGAPSTLAVWEALEARREGEWLVILTPVDERELGDGTLAHLIGAKLFTPDPWAALRSTFSANTIEPTLYKTADDRALAFGLLAALAPVTVTPAPGGVLTRDHVMATLARESLHVTDDPEVEIDALAVLEWSLRPQVRNDLGTLAGAGGPLVMAAAGEWLAGKSGRLNNAVRSLLAGQKIAEVVPLGLVVGLVADGRPGTELAQGKLFGRYDLDGLDSGDLQAWFHDAAGLVVGQLTAPERRGVLDAAASVAHGLGMDSLARESEFLPQGLAGRFEALAEAIDAAVPQLATPIVRERVSAAEDGLARLTRHILAAGDPSTPAAQACVRLLRWLVTDDVPAGGLTDRLAHYVTSGSWVDAALVTAWRGVDNPALAAAVSRVIARVSERRRVEDREFGAALADTPEPDVLTVEQIVPRVVIPLAKERPTLLLVIDALSCAAANELVDAASEFGWSEASLVDTRDRGGALAVLPTLTGRSRCSLLSGELREGNDTAERAGFLSLIRDAGLQAHTDPIFHKKALDTTPSGADLATDVATAIADPTGRPLVAAVLNYVDDTLHHTDPGGTSWTLGTITHLRALLQAALRAGRAVIITSDHGHIIERRTSHRLQRAQLYGQRAHGDLSSVGDGEVLIQGPRVLTDSRSVVLAVDDDIRYGPLNAGYHGGASPAEAVVPVIALYTGDIPATLHQLGNPEPGWWSGLAAEPSAGPPVPVVGTDAPTLFDEPEVSEPDAQPDAVAQVLHSAVFGSQFTLAGRIVITREQIGTLLAALLSTSSRELTTTQAAGALNVPAGRAAGALLQAKRVLDVEGYEVLVIDSGVVKLDESLLREQFGIGS